MRYGIAGLIALAIAAVVVATSVFIVYPQQQALVLQFGAVKRAINAPGQEDGHPGLYFKIPLVQNVAYLDKRVLDLDMETQEVIASDQKRLVVDAFARYRIADPVRFYQTVGTIAGGNARLSTFVSSTLRAVLAEATFQAVVRDQRAELMGRIRNQVDRQAEELGIDIVDVRIRRADLPQANSQAIFQRMQTERRQEATKIRSDGERLATEIRSRADREAQVIRATAQSDAESIRGDGDGERNRLYAEAFGRDPEFFAFYRAMQAYEAGLKASDTRLVITPNSDFFRYFTDPSGKSSRPNLPGPPPGPIPPRAAAPDQTPPAMPAPATPEPETAPMTPPAAPEASPAPATPAPPASPPATTPDATPATPPAAAPDAAPAPETPAPAPPQ